MDLDGDYFDDDDDYDDNFELEDDFSSDTTSENDEEPEEDNFDVEDAMFWGGLGYMMSEDEREERTRKKKDEVLKS